MIDWVTAKLPCRNNVNAGYIAKVDCDGNVEWLNQSYLTVEGTYSSNICLKSITPNTIQISGNPVKWLQGHNLFGTNDLKFLVFEFFKTMFECYDLGLNPTDSDWQMIKDGLYTVSRVDVNETWHLRNRFEVLSWIRSAGSKVSVPYRGKGAFSGDTLYWGKGSKRFYMKCYSKGDEIDRKGSNFPNNLRIPKMLEYADKSLRLEICLMSNFLRTSKLNMVCNWSADTARMLLLRYVRELDMSSNFCLDDEILNKIPRKLKAYYKLWLHGEDLRKELSRATFYRVRSQLKQYDIDIALVRDIDKPLDNVVPLVKVLEAEPVGIPFWAFNERLVVASDNEWLKFMACNDDVLSEPERMSE